MNEPETIPFDHPSLGPVWVSVQATEGTVAVRFSQVGPDSEMILPASAAVRLGHALLEASGENPQSSPLKLPHTRQIGGIIGPY